jgi:hypothetical protein
MATPVSRHWKVISFLLLEIVLYHSVRSKYTHLFKMFNVFHHLYSIHS